MNLESPKKEIDKSQEELFNSLTDVKNFEKLMPDTIAKFEVINENEFIFGLKGMPEIQLKIKDKVPPSKIVYSAVNDKLPFTLTANIASLGEKKSAVQLHFEGEFNMMMAMMVKGPITKFIETLVGNMDKI